MPLVVCYSVMSLWGRMIMEGTSDHGWLVEPTFASDEACHRAPKGKHHGQQQQNQDTKIFQGN